MYRAFYPSLAQAASAVVVCPPGSRTNCCNRCFILLWGYSATTTTRSMLLRPKPATSDGANPSGEIKNGRRTSGILPAAPGGRHAGVRPRSIGGVDRLASVLNANRLAARVEPRHVVAKRRPRYRAPRVGHGLGRPSDRDEPAGSYSAPALFYPGRYTLAYFDRHPCAIDDGCATALGGASPVLIHNLVLLAGLAVAPELGLSRSLEETAHYSPSSPTISPPPAAQLRDLHVTHVAVDWRTMMPAELERLPVFPQLSFSATAELGPVPLIWPIPPLIFAFRLRIVTLATGALKL